MNIDPKILIRDAVLAQVAKKEVPRDFLSKKINQHKNNLRAKNFIIEHYAPMIIDQILENLTRNILHIASSGEYDKEVGLFLYGQVGCGKTEIMNYYSSKLRTDIIKIETINRKFLEYKDADFFRWADQFNDKDLIIDEAFGGREVKKYGTQSPVIEFFRQREEQYRKRNVITHFTSNIENINELESYGSRIASRLKGMCQFVNFGNSYDFRVLQYKARHKTT